VGRLRVLVLEALLSTAKRRKRSIFSLKSGKPIKPVAKVQIAGSAFRTSPAVGSSGGQKAEAERLYTFEQDSDFCFYITESLSPYIDVSVLDASHEDVILSRCRIRFDRIVWFGKEGETVDKWYHLKRSNGKEGQPEPAGQIHLKVTIEFDPAYLKSLQPQPQKDVTDDFESEGGEFQPYLDLPDEEDDKRSIPSGPQSFPSSPSSTPSPAYFHPTPPSISPLQTGSTSPIQTDMLSGRVSSTRSTPSPVRIIGPNHAGTHQSILWEYKWLDGDEVFGPFGTDAMLLWKAKGFFIDDMKAWIRIASPGVPPLNRANDGFVLSDTIDFSTWQ